MPVLFQPGVGQSSRFRNGVLKMFNSAGVGLALDAFQEAFVIQEKFATEYLVAIKLLKEIAGGKRYLTKRLVRMLRSPGGKNGLRFGETLLVHKREAMFQLRNGGKGGPLIN